MGERRYTLDDLRYLMARLRDPADGCPWDREQNFNSIIKYSIEEVYELADAIAQADYKQVCDELGDVLFQVIFFSQMAQEQNAFEFSDVTDGIVRKLLRRHPHVFPDGNLTERFGGTSSRADTVKEQWESIKAAERQNRQLLSALDDVPASLPALSRAHKLQKRAAQVGFDWNDIESIFAKIDEETAELREAMREESEQEIEAEFGDLLFACVNLARHLNIDSETALRSANRKFDRRFRYIEDRLADEGRTPDDAALDEMDRLWNEAKRRE